MTMLFGFNQILHSAMQIPGAIPAGDVAAGTKAIHIALGNEQSNDEAPLYAKVGNALQFNAPQIASYFCQSDRIDVRPCPDANPESVANLLIATAVPATLWMQGRFVLHAAAVVPETASSAIAIAGPSGAGKSFLAKQLVERGARLLADDSIALEITDNGIIASGLPGGIHCRSGSGDSRRFEPVASDKTFRSAPLAGIFVLNRLPAELPFTELGKMAAVESVIANQHRPRIPAMWGRVAQVLAQAAQIADRVPVRLWNQSEVGTMSSKEEQEILSFSLQGRASI